MLACAERLPHPGAFELIRDAEPLTPVARFGSPSSVQRHYERLTRVPEGFLCIGDAICSFNPIWGQGMSVAALEVVALAELLEQRATQRAAAPEPHSAGDRGLAPAFYAAAAITRSFTRSDFSRRCAPALVAKVLPLLDTASAPA